MTRFFHRSVIQSINSPKLRQLFFTVGVVAATLTLLSMNSFPAAALTSPTVTPTAGEISVPDSGEPVILQPGNTARLISPLNIKILTRPGDDGLIRIELIGHDNRLIFRRLLDYTSFKGNTILVDQQIPFEIRDEETARLQVVLEDGKGKINYLTSVQLTLLTIKGTETNGEAAVYPRVNIENPLIDSSVKGADLVVAAGLKPVNNTPVVVEVLASDWHTLTSKIIKITIPADQTAFTPIEVKLPFKTGAKIPVTIRIRQESNNLITGPVLIWSEKVTLTP